GGGGGDGGAPAGQVAPAEGEFCAMAAGHVGGIDEFDVGLRLLETGRIDDLAPDPARVGLAGHRLDDEPGQPESMVRIFEARVAGDGRRLGEGGPKLALVEEGAPVHPLAAVPAVAADAGAVRP